MMILVAGGFVIFISCVIIGVCLKTANEEYDTDMGGTTTKGGDTHKNVQYQTQTNKV